jgi:hypothetical protein
MDDELLADLIAAIEAARADGEGQLQAVNLKARLEVAGLYVERMYVASEEESAAMEKAFERLDEKRLRKRPSVIRDEEPDGG